MKIEHIIADIISDVTNWTMILEERFEQENPGLNFSIATPNLAKLSTVKSIVLTVMQGNTAFHFGVDVHTHNGNRVFENSTRHIITDEHSFTVALLPIQKQFVTLLRAIIKKQKKGMIRN